MKTVTIIPLYSNKLLDRVKEAIQRKHDTWRVKMLAQLAFVLCMPMQSNGSFRMETDDSFDVNTHPNLRASKLKKRFAGTATRKREVPKN